MHVDFFPPLTNHEMTVFPTSRHNLINGKWLKSVHKVVFTYDSHCLGRLGLRRATGVSLELFEPKGHQ